LSTASSPLPPPLDPRTIRGVIFDLDGTLIDSYSAIATSLNHARAAFDLPPLPPLFVRRRVGHGLESLIADLVGPRRIDEGVRLFRERYASVYAAETVALRGAVTILSRLAARGYRLSIASNKPARFSIAILETLGMGEGLSCVAGPDVVGSTKPDPEMIRFCLRRMDVDPAHAVYVGDMLLDVESAARAEVAVILVEGGSSDAKDLRNTGQMVLGSLSSLDTLLPGVAPG